MSYVFEGFEPQAVWKHFYEINQIPRCSKNEEGVRKHIINLAEKLNLEYKEDETGNIVIKKDASPGMENKPIVVIQGHMDMVCEKNEGTVHDFTKDPIVMVRGAQTLAHAFRTVRNYDKAGEYLQRAFELLKEVPPTDDICVCFEASLHSDLGVHFSRSRERWKFKSHRRRFESDDSPL